MNFEKLSRERERERERERGRSVNDHGNLVW